ncbi:MAG: aldo/keto reductase [Anaerolineales bacterium]|nr:aldo/keto reductase [Anaerolineales bacterium]
MVKEGKVRYGGVSNFSVEQMKRIQKIHPIASLQPPYSMVNRGIEKETLPFCTDNQIGVIAYSPMQAGLLTGKMTKERVAAFPTDDWRKGSPDFQEPRLSTILNLVDALRPIAETKGLPVATLALIWVLHQPGVTGAIVGARRPDQIEETSQTMELVLTEEEWAAVNARVAECERQLA